MVTKARQQVILEGSDIIKSYPGKAGDDRLVVLDGVSIAVQKGSIISVVGPSGSGKSTLLHVLGGLDKPDSGSVIWDQKDIYRLNADELAAFRNRKLGFVFQFHHLLPEFTAIENVMMPALIAGDPLEQASEKAFSLLERFGIPGRSEHRPTQLSGGEQQRVALARALMNNPDLILADEPTGNLDEANTEIVLEMLFELRQNDEVSILLITHEKDIAFRSDTVYELNKSKLRELPDPAD